MKIKDELKSKLLNLSKKGIDLGNACEQLGSASLLLFPVEPSASLSISLISTAVGKTIKGASSAIQIFERKKASDGLNDPESQAVLRHLVIQRAYLEKVAIFLTDHPGQKNDTDVSEQTFSLLFGDTATIHDGNHTIQDLINRPELFQPYKNRLSSLLKGIFPRSEDVEIQIRKIDEESRALVIRIFRENPQLASSCMINSIAKIESDVSELRNKLPEFWQEITGRHDRSEINSERIEEAAEKNFGEIKDILASFQESAKIDAKKEREEIRQLVTEIRAKSLPAIISDRSDARVSQLLDANLTKAFDSARAQLQTGSISTAYEGFKSVITLTDGLEDDESRRLRARSISNQGIIRLIRGDEQEAARLFIQAYENCENHVNVKCLRGLAFQIQGNPAKGLQFLEDCNNETKKDECWILINAQLLKEVEGAESALKFLTENYLESESWFDLNARYLTELGLNDLAVNKADEGLAKFANSVELLLAKAVAIAQPLTAGQLVRDQKPSDSVVLALEKAEGLFEQTAVLLKNRGRDREFVECQVNRAAILLSLARYEDLEKVLRTAQELLPDEPRVLNLQVASCWRSGDYREARKIAGKYHAKINTIESAERYISFLIANREANEALDVIDGLLNDYPESGDHPRVQSYKLDALRQAHRRTEADEFAVELLSRFPRSPFVLGVLGGHYSARKEDAKAEKYYLQALSLASDSVEIGILRAQLGIFYYSRRKWRKVIEYLNHDFDALEWCFHPSELAHSYLELDEIDKSYKLAATIPREIAEDDLLEIRSWIEFALYQYDQCVETLTILIRRAPNRNWSMRLAEASIRMGQRDAAYGILRDLADAQPNDIEVLMMVSQGCYHMKLYREGFDFAKKAIIQNPKDQNAKMLISRALVLDESQIVLSPEEISILQTSLEDNNSIERIPIVAEPDGDIDVSPILDRIKSSGIAKEQLISRYREVRGPLSMLVPALDVDVWSVWKGITKSTNCSIYMSGGTHEEQQKQSDISNAAKRVCVDFSALLTLRELGFLYLLVEFYDEVIVSMDTRKIFQDSIDHCESLKKTTGSLAHEGGNFYFLEQQTDELEDDLIKLYEIEQFLREGLIKPKGLSSDIHEQWRKGRNMDYIPELMFLPVGVSLSENIPLLTDQAMSGALLTSLGGTGNFCSQAFLRSCVSRGLISSDQYEEAILKLLELKYEFVSISAATVITAFENDNEQYGHSLKVVLNSCSGGNARNESTANILGEAAAAVWLRKFSTSDERETVIIAIAKAAGIFELSPNLLASFLRGIYTVLNHRPSAIYGIIHVLERFPGISSSSKRLIFLARKRIGLSVLGAMKRGGIDWIPAARCWLSQSQAEKYLGSYFREANSGVAVAVGDDTHSLVRKKGKGKRRVKRNRRKGPR